MSDHRLFIGFHTTEAALLDRSPAVTTAVLSRSSAARLPAEVARRFAAIGRAAIDDADDLDAYDDGFGLIREKADELAHQFGLPSAVVGVYEHTTLPAARLREHFGLPGTSVEAATACRDKVVMKRAVQAAGVPVPRFIPVGPDVLRGELEAFAAGGQRFVVKPRSQSASTGVRVVADPEALLDLADTDGLQADDEVEDFVEGVIHHVDGVVRSGALRWMSVSRYVNSCLAFRSAAQPVASVTVDDPVFVERARWVTQAVLDAVGLVDSVFHLELIHTPDDNLVFLEIAARPGGAGVPLHCRTVHGVDLFDEALRACTGDPTAVDGAVPWEPRAGASGFLLIPAPGGPGRHRVERISGLEALPPSVVHLEVPAVGDDLHTEGLWADAGRFLLRGASTADLERDVAAIADSYQVTTSLGDEA